MSSLNITPGQTVHEALIDGCRKENQIIRNNFKGVISIDNYDLAPADNLIEGRTAMGIGYTMDATHRYSEYTVYSQSKSQENFLTLEGSTLSKETKRDSDISGKIFKPKVLSISSGDTPGIIRKRAEYEELINRSKSIQAKAIIFGFRQTNGSIWDIWSKSRVVAPRLGIDEDLLVSGLTYEFEDTKGTITSLDLTGVNAFRPDPYVREKKDGEGEGSEFKKALKL